MLLLIIHIGVYSDHLSQYFESVEYEPADSSGVLEVACIHACVCVLDACVHVSVCNV